jgi:hypothetical protein
MQKTWISITFACALIVASAAAEERHAANPSALEDLKGYRIRVVKPGQMMDQAVLPDRITVWVDTENRVTEAKYR